MTLFEVEELTCYWTEHPPLHLLIAAYLGKQRGKPAATSKLHPGAAATSNRKSEQILADLGPAFLNGDVHAGLGSVLLDVRELRRKTEAAYRTPISRA
jgi:hypothetical protein